MFTEEIVPLQVHRQFVRYFRMSMTTVDHLVERIRHSYIGKRRPGGKPEISLKTKVLMTINFLGSKDTCFE